MLRHGYDKNFSLGTIAGSSILGMLIPPSVLLILYGIIAQESIGDLFTAGVVPGIVLALTYSAGISLMVKIKPRLVRKADSAALVSENFVRFRLKMLTKTLPIVILIMVVLGGIYSGYFTPTEAGAVGAFGALVMALGKRRLTGRTLWHIMLETSYVTAAILFILVAANMYSRTLTISGLPHRLCETFSTLALPPVAIIILFMFFLVLLGAILDSASIILITIPIMLPVVTTMGYDPIWFGIISVIAIETGLITPPFGIVVYTMKATLGHDVSVEQVFRGSVPFLIMMLLVLALVIIFPELTLWLPGKV
jgi:tripartite ATP-independent transporter DctM subunit